MSATMSRINGSYDITRVLDRRSQPLSTPPASSRFDEPLRMPQADRVEISDQARWMDRLRQLAPDRAEVVRQVRTEIASGGYITEQKIDVAIERLAAELGRAGISNENLASA